MGLAEYGYEITTKTASEEWGSTEYKIIDSGSGGGTFAKDSSQATMVYICQYDYVERFLDTVLGKTVLVDGELRRSAATPNFDPDNGSLPEEHPYFWNFYAASAEVLPRGQSYNEDFGTQVYPLWQKAIVTVVFRPPTYLVIPDDEEVDEVDRFVTKVTEGQQEFQTSMGYFQFVGTGGRQLPITPGQTVPALRLTYTWHQIPVLVTDGRPDLGRIPNIDSILPLLGSVNTEEFDGYPPGSVLFNNWSAKLICPQTATANGYYWDISYVLGVRNYGASTTPKVTGEVIGWNYAFDPQSNVWRLYTTDGLVSGNTMYPYKDLNDLFAVNW